MTTYDDTWDANIVPLELRVSVTWGNGRCRVEAREGSTHVVTIDVSERPARLAARHAFRLLAEHMHYLQAEAGR